MTKPKPKPSVPSPAVITVPETMEAYLALVAAAEKEWKAVRAAQRAGKPAPPAPHLHAFEECKRLGITVASFRRGRRTASTASGGATQRQWWKDGRRMSPGSNSLSFIVWEATAGICNADGLLARKGEETVERVPTATVREWLAAADIDPKCIGWSALLPNGHTIGVTEATAVSAPIEHVSVGPRRVVARRRSA